jgi:hypothetical protein
MARAPTRFAEYLAAGMVIAASPGIGDLDALIREHRVGALVDGEDEESLRVATEELRRLSEDPEAPVRSRALAYSVFSLETAIRSYLSLYEDLIRPAPRAEPVLTPQVQ